MFTSQFTVPDPKPWRAVIDPALALSQYGLTLVQQLSTVMELWVGREFWHLLDQAASDQLSAHLSTHFTIEMQEAAAAWSAFRAERDGSNLGLFWIGDRLSESYLPRHVSPDLLQHWERLAHSLDAKLASPLSPEAGFELAFRDTLALAATLKTACILTHQTAIDLASPSIPYLCQVMQRWKLSCQGLAAHDNLMQLERDRIRQLLIQTQSAKLLWAGLHLAVLHLILPAIATQYSFVSSRNTTAALERCPNPDVMWQGAQGFWYAL